MITFCDDHHFHRKLSSLSGVKICFTFCLVAVLYLSSIAVMLGAHSQYRYIKIGSADKDKKLKMVEGVTQAICMYLVCLVISGYVWYTASNQKKYRDDDIRLLD